MGAACDVAALGLGLAVAAALLACHRCAEQTQTPPGGSGCMPELVSLSPCMDYMSGNATAPDAPCCTALSGVLRSNPWCLCMVLGGTAASLGVAVDSALALQLPGACKVQTPPASQCNSVGVPVPSPVNPTTPGSTPATPSAPNVSPAASNTGSGSKSTPSTTQYSDGNIDRSRRILAFVIVAAIALIHRV